MCLAPLLHLIITSLVAPISGLMAASPAQEETNCIRSERMHPIVTRYQEIILSELI